MLPGCGFGIPVTILLPVLMLIVLLMLMPARTLVSSTPVPNKIASHAAVHLPAADHVSSRTGPSSKQLAMSFTRTQAISDNDFIPSALVSNAATTTTVATAAATSGGRRRPQIDGLPDWIPDPAAATAAAVGAGGVTAASAPGTLNQTLPYVPDPLTPAVASIAGPASGSDGSGRRPRSRSRASRISGPAAAFSHSVDPLLLLDDDHRLKRDGMITHGPADSRVAPADGYQTPDTPIFLSSLFAHEKGDAIRISSRDLLSG